MAIDQAKVVAELSPAWLDGLDGAELEEGRRLLGEVVAEWAREAGQVKVEITFDVNIEGISLVSNYRTQFNKIIQTNGYNSLVERMKVKQNEFLEEGGGKRKAQK